MKRFTLFLGVWSMVFSFALVNVVLADSTIGTSITTTGSLTVNSASGTAVRFQNGSGTNLFIFDTSNTRFGINSGGAVDTKLDVGGTASASYFLSSGAVQFASNVASVAYSRFGASTTKRSNYITASNDLLVSGDLETVGSVAFGGTASVSGIFFMTDGQFRPSVNSTTAFRFQNAAGGTNVLTIDTTNLRIGVGKTPSTKFEVGGTASATYFMSNNAVQFASNVASVAYSRFGASTTKRSNYITASNDLLVSGDLETVGSVAFGGTASVSGIFFMTDGQFRPSVNSTTAFRFQNAAGSTNVLTIDTTNTRVGVNAGGVVDTTFEVGGTSSISGLALFGGNASVAGNFELTGSSPLFGINAGALINTAFEVGGAASVGTNFNVGENSAATTSVTFETKGATKGVCFVITDSAGTVWYARIAASVNSQGKWWITTISCL